MEEAVRYFLTVHNQIKLYHWATSSYGIHKALDDLHEQLGTQIDRFIECYIGHYKKQPVKTSKIKIDITLTGDSATIRRFLQNQCEQLSKMAKDYEESPGFENILAEMVSLFDNAIYLCNLH